MTAHRFDWSRVRFYGEAWGSEDDVRAFIEKVEKATGESEKTPPATEDAS